MTSVLVHVTRGPENPTKAALAFFVAEVQGEGAHGSGESGRSAPARSEWHIEGEDRR
jgi:hypothetical protein